tara:strand:- start:141 stop:554 length:414 start_codon:yes stop_codon:yes gene_type:complete
LIKKISEKDKKDWEDFINNNQKIPNKDKIIEKDFNKVSKKIDLHGYNLRDANIAVNNLINDAYNSGVEKLIIVTGKGMRSKNEQDPYRSNKLSILKYSVPHYIQHDKELMKRIKEIDLKEVENLNSGNFSITLKIKK